MRETFCGTPLYVSPELLKRKNYNNKIDVWSVGILTYELLFGRVPFEIVTEKDFVKIVYGCLCRLRTRLNLQRLCLFRSKLRTSYLSVLRRIRGIDIRFRNFLSIRSLPSKKILPLLTLPDPYFLMFAPAAPIPPSLTLRPPPFPLPSFHTDPASWVRVVKVAGRTPLNVIILFVRWKNLGAGRPQAVSRGNPLSKSAFSFCQLT